MQDSVTEAKGEVTSPVQLPQSQASPRLPEVPFGFILGKPFSPEGAQALE